MLFAVIWILAVLRQTIPVMKEEIEIFWAAEDGIAPFAVEDCGMVLAHTGSKFVVWKGDGITNGFIESLDHVVKTGDKVFWPD